MFKCAIRVSIVVCAVIASLFVAVILFGQARPAKERESAPPATFRDMPGITEEEIRDIERVLASRESLVCGMLESTECFFRNDGTMGGFGILMCGALSEFFGIPFTPFVYTRQELSEGLLSGGIDFSVDFTPVGNQADSFIMTEPFTDRAIMYARRKGSPLYPGISHERAVRYGFLFNSFSETILAPNSVAGRETYINVTVESMEKAIEKLKNFEIDLFIADCTLINTLLIDPDIETRELSPLLFKRVPVVTANPDLAPLVRILDKYLAVGGRQHLQRFHSQGKTDFNRQAFIGSLTETERSFYEDRIRSGVPILYGITSNNYPVGFYDNAKKQWSGISVDVLREISSFTGIAFQPGNATDANWPEVYGIFERGEVPMIAELLRTPSRDGRFLWANKPNAKDQYVLISRNGCENIDVNQIINSRIGMQANTGQTEKFLEWFPHHRDTVLFETYVEALNALERKEIDFVMASENRYQTISTYMERSDFKINLVFSDVSNSSFGFNLQEKTLQGVINKAMSLVDIDRIATTWRTRIFDYGTKLTQTRYYYTKFLYVTGFIIASLFSWLLFNRIREARRLAWVVAERTRDLEEQTQATQAASAAKTSFLANMSHEMRTPMNAVVGFSELLLAEENCGGSCRTECNRHISMIHSAGLTLLSIINDILDISKIESGKFEIIPVEYDLPSLVNDVISLNLIRISDKPIEFRLDIDDSLPSKLEGDDLRIKQICHNLLSNAFKYTKGGEVVLGIACEREAGGDYAWMIIRVRDTGIGIREEDIQKLFSEYNQVDTRSNRCIEGTGLGLMLTKRMAEMMNGSISVESEYGKGSIFTVRIQQKHVTDVPIGPKVAAEFRNLKYGVNKSLGRARLTRIYLPYAKVLIVDDVRANLEVAKGMMKPYRMQVDCVASGEEAIAAVRREKVRYNAIFMDHMMPRMDGVEATRIIREEIGTEYAKNVPIIMLTANALVGNEEMFLSLGFNAFLSKPIDMARLDAVIRQWVRNKDIEQAMKDQGTCIDAETPQNARTERERLKSRLARWDIQGMELEAALKRFGTEDAFLRVMKVFSEDTPGFLDRIRHVTEENLRDYTIAVHGLKGSCRGICAESLAAQADKLEFAARTNQYAYIEAHNDSFIREVEEFLASLRKMSGTHIKAKKPMPDAAVMANLLKACRQFDINGVDRAMAELVRYDYETGGELVRWLRETVKVMGFKEISQRLSKTLGV